MKFLLVIAVIYFVFYFMFRLIPWILRRYLKKMTNNMEKQQKEYYNNKKHEGDVNIDYIPDSNKNDLSDNDSNGEYVDFEEVE